MSTPKTVRPYAIRLLGVTLQVAPGQNPWEVVDCAQTLLGQAAAALDAIADSINYDADMQSRAYAVANALTLVDGMLCDALERSARPATLRAAEQAGGDA
jgi:hypothetical protein